MGITLRMSKLRLQAGTVSDEALAQVYTQNTMETNTRTASQWLKLTDCKGI